MSQRHLRAYFRDITADRLSDAANRMNRQSGSNDVFAITRSGQHATATGQAQGIMFLIGFIASMGEDGLERVEDASLQRKLRGRGA